MRATPKKPVRLKQSEASEHLPSLYVMMFITWLLQPPKHFFPLVIYLHESSFVLCFSLLAELAKQEVTPFLPNFSYLSDEQTLLPFSVLLLLIFAFDFPYPAVAIAEEWDRVTFGADSACLAVCLLSLVTSGHSAPVPASPVGLRSQACSQGRGHWV